MKYVCLGYIQQSRWELMHADAQEQLLTEGAAYDKMMRSQCNGFAQLLNGDRACATLELSGGRIAIAETEIAGSGYRMQWVWVLSARDLNHAIQLLADHPALRHGAQIEIRRA